MPGSDHDRPGVAAQIGLAGRNEYRCRNHDRLGDFSSPEHDRTECTFSTINPGDLAARRSASFFGALAYAELGAMMPATGGQYVYLRTAWGPLWGFLCAGIFYRRTIRWDRRGCSGFLHLPFVFVSMPLALSRTVAAALILALTLRELSRCETGRDRAEHFYHLEIARLGDADRQHVRNWRTRYTPASLAAFGIISGSPGYGDDACFWHNNGGVAISLVGGEIKDPQRNLPRSDHPRDRQS